MFVSTNPPVVLVRRRRGLRGLGVATAVVSPGGSRVVYDVPAPPTAPVAQAPAYADGTFLRGASSATIYIMRSGVLYAFPDQATFLAAGGTWAGVTVISDAAIAALPQGGVYSAPAAPATTAAAAFATTPATIQPGATYNYGISAYVNPDGSLVYTAPPAASATSAAGQVTTVLQPGATYDASTGIYTNPDGSIVYSSAATGATSAAGQVTTVLQPGATYNASTGIYTNPDGSIVYSSAASTSSTLTSDISSMFDALPSWWPYVAIAGVAWLLLRRKGR